MFLMGSQESGAPALPGQTGCSLTSILVRRVRALGGDDAVREVLRRAGSSHSAAFLEDVGNWVDYEEACALLALPGIGPWTAEYIAMRALRDPDAFLPSDLGVRRALERAGRDGRPAAAAALAERWRPYRAYALQHLWASLSAPTGLALAA